MLGEEIMVEITRDYFTKYQIIHHLAEIARDVHRNGVSSMHGKDYNYRLETVHEFKVKVAKDSPAHALSQAELDKVRR
jgi:hypothetical protein